MHALDFRRHDGRRRKILHVYISDFANRVYALFHVFPAGETMLDYYRFKDIDDLFARGRNDEARHLLMEMQARYIAVNDRYAFLPKEIEDRGMVITGDIGRVLRAAAHALQRPAAGEVSA